METTSVRNLEENMVSNNEFTLLVPLDDYYDQVNPRDRDLVYTWLNGMVSPYSIALAIIDIRLKNNTDGYAELSQCLEWLSVPNQIELSTKVLFTLINVIQPYILTMLNQSGLDLNVIRLTNTFENTLNEWSCGYVTLTLSTINSGTQCHFIGTSYPQQQNSNPVPVPIANLPQVPNYGFHNHH